MATECEQPNKGIDGRAYNAAMRPGTNFEISQLKEALNTTTKGSRNTLLHVAASVGNLKFIQELLKLNPLLVKPKNAQGNTALHLAAQGGFSKVVEILLQQPESGVDVCNDLGETPLFKACESGYSATVMKLLKASPTNLKQNTGRGQTCLYVAIVKGNSELLSQILKSEDAKGLIQVKFENDDSALHVASRKNYVHIMRQLIEFEPELCCWVNDSGETPLCVAATLGHLEAVKELINAKPEAVEIRNKCGMNVLHLVAQVSQTRIVHYLNKTVGLLDLVNQGMPQESAEKTDLAEKEAHASNLNEGDKTRNNEKIDGVDSLSKERPQQSARNTDPAEKGDPFAKISEGDTPLHIAVRNKEADMVDSLLRIPGINKDAVNMEGLTAFDIARENTEYNESFRIIERLGNFPRKGKPFLYNAPKVSSQKLEKVKIMVDKAFADRHDAELVVAVLLATIAFTAAFTIPGGFKTDDEKGEEQKLGTPLLIRSISFKMFIIFDCIAFFLSLFVVLAWQISTPLATEHRFSSVYMTNLVVCFTSAFITYGFMSAVYTMLEQNKLAWAVLGACMIITFCSSLSLVYMWSAFLLKMVREKHLCGADPVFSDRLVEHLWIKLEEKGFMDLMCWCNTKFFNFLHYNSPGKVGANSKRGSVDNV